MKNRTLGITMTTTEDLRGKRVLLVEDESPITMLLEDLLGDMGCFVVAVAPRLPDAIEKAEMLSYDVAILDVNLNGKYTFPLAEQLMKRNVPFVFSTGYGRSIIPQGLQAVPVLQKPFQQRDLVEALRVALAQGK